MTGGTGAMASANTPRCEPGAASALRALGKTDAGRRLVIEFCRNAEQVVARESNPRETIVGPIMDAVFEGATWLRKTLANGLVFEFHYRSKIARDLLLGEEHPDHIFEPQTTRLLLHLAANAQAVLIGGAYGGDHALLAAKAMEARGGTCHAFEPNPEQFALLEHNARLNRIANIAANQLGLWDAEGSTLRLVGDDACASPVETTAPAAGEVTFTTTTIDAYGASRGLERLDVVMLDIEGGEYRALRGAGRYLAQPAGAAPAVIFEVHRAYVDWSAGLLSTPAVRLLNGHGYRVFAIRDFQSNQDMRGCKIELVTPETAYLEGPPHGFNMLAVKDESVVRSELFRTCEGVSPKLLRHRNPALHYPSEWLP